MAGVPKYKLHVACVFDLGTGVENAPAGSGRAVAAGIPSNAFRSLSRAQHAARTRAHTAQTPGLPLICVCAFRHECTFLLEALMVLALCTSPLTCNV
jgi:hypothetical protein